MLLFAVGNFYLYRTHIKFILKNTFVQWNLQIKDTLGLFFCFLREAVRFLVVSNVSQVLKKLVFGPVSFVWMDSFIQNVLFQCTLFQFQYLLLVTIVISRYYLVAW